MGRLSTEEPFDQWRLGRQYEIVSGFAQPDPVIAFDDIPVTDVFIVSREQSGVDCHRHTSRFS
jgi:hypothetical protein